MPQITPYLAEIVPMFPVLRPHFSQLGSIYYGSRLSLILT